MLVAPVSALATRSGSGPLGRRLTLIELIRVTLQGAEPNRWLGPIKKTSPETAAA
jgi:hypothetical protein